MPDTTVKYFSSDMSGAPALSGTAGTLISVLDACLVNGFGAVTINTLVVASGVATATVSTGHGFAMIGGLVGPVIQIGGATPAGLNIEWRVASVTNSTVFTFACPGIADGTASGTITSKRAPAGFEKVEGTNKAAYRSLNIAGTRLYCQIDDTYTTYSRIRGYEVMTDVDTGTGLFPTGAQISGGGYIYKATAVNRPWTLYTDGRMIYFFCDSANNATWPGGFVFGDIDSYVGSDAFGCLLIATGSTTGTNSLYLFNSTSISYLARAYTQLGGSALSARYSHLKTGSALGQGGQAFPALSDNCLHLWPVEVWDGSTNARGMMPGLWNPVHASDVPHGLIVDNIPNLPGRTLRVQMVGSSSYRCAIDLTGPWR